MPIPTKREKSLPFDWYFDHRPIGCKFAIRETFLTKEERDEAMVNCIASNEKEFTDRLISMNVGDGREVVSTGDNPWDDLLQMIIAKEMAK
jgi:hypothetical protein